MIGAVAAFPFPNVNLPLNGYIEGAKSVNPDVEAKVTYLESWFDPPKGRESAAAQLAAGADFIYAERFGPFEAVSEKQNSFASATSSTRTPWRPRSSSPAPSPSGTRRSRPPSTAGGPTPPTARPTTPRPSGSCSP